MEIGSDSERVHTDDSTPSRRERVRAVAPVVAVALLLVIVVLLAMVLALSVFGLSGLLSDPAPIAAFDLEEREGYQLEVTLLSVGLGDEFWVLDGDDNRIDGSTMTVSGDSVTIPLVCSPDMGEELTIMGVNGDHEAIMETTTVTEIGIEVDGDWQFDFEYDERVRGVDVHGEFVYASNYHESRLKKIAIENQSEMWEYDGLPSAIRPVTYHDGYVYAGSGYGTPEIHRINATTGAESWSIDGDDLASGSGEAIHHVRDIEVVDESLIVGTQDGGPDATGDNDGTLLEVDRETGEVVGDPVDAGASVKGVTVDDRHVYTADGNGTITQYPDGDLTDVGWTYQHQPLDGKAGLGEWGATSIQAGYIEANDEWAIYSASDDGPVVKHDREDGTAEWEYTELDDMKWGLAVDTHGNVYTGKAGDAEIHRISPSGCQVWSFPDPNDNVDEMAIDDDGNIYAGDGDGILYRMNQPTE